MSRFIAIQRFVHDPFAVGNNRFRLIKIEGGVCILPHHGMDIGWSQL